MAATTGLAARLAAGPLLPGSRAASLLPGVAGAALPGLRSVPGPGTDVVLAVVLVLLLLLAAGWALYARAVRVDRLHRQVLGARATLEAQILHRAEAAAELASTGILDPASCLLLAQAARDALDAEGPIIRDGLDPVPRLDSTDHPAGLAAAAGPGRPSGTLDPAAPVSSQETQEDRRSSRSRAQVESDLSRVLRTVLDVPARSALAASPQAAAALDRLDKACYRMVLARRFHNTHVAEAQALRRRVGVRLLHLAGHAPMPQTFDVDDRTEPEQGSQRAGAGQQETQDERQEERREDGQQ